MTGHISVRRDRQSASRSLGFTLVELLVVIAIIAMLTALLVPAVQRARESGRRATCMNNQQQIGKAVMNYATSKDRLPSGFSNHPDTTVATACMGWVPPMLPYIEQKPLYDQIMTATGVQLLVQPLPRKYEIPLLICPTWSRTGSEMAPLSYVVNAGMKDFYPPTGNASRDYQENGVFFDHFKPAMPAVGKTVTTDLSYITRNDGTSTTVLFSESVETRDWLGRAGATSPYWPTDPAQDPGSTWWQGIVWYGYNIPSNGVGYLNRPAQPGVPQDDKFFGKPTSQHPGGFLTTFVDGHTIFVSEDVDYRLFALLMAPASNNAKEPTTNKTGTMLYTGTGWWDPSTGALRTVTEADLTR